MGIQVENKTAEQAQAELAKALRPRSIPPGGIRPDEYETTTAGLQKLQNEMQIGHDRPKSKS
jgi:hypothetical protein